MSNMQKRFFRGINLKKWVGILISILMVLWVFGYFDFSEIKTAIKITEYIYLLPLPLIILANFTLRAIRWGTLFEADKAPCLKALFSSMMIGYLANNILPARAGEVVRAHILGQRENISKSLILGTVIVERVIDLLIAILLLLIVLLFYPLPAWLGNIGVVIVLCLFAIFIIILTSKIKLTDLQLMLKRGLFLLPEKALNLIISIIESFIVGITAVFKNRQGVKLVFISLLIWMSELMIAFLIARSFHLKLTLGDTLFVMVVIGLSSIVPSSPGSLGTYEFFGVNALSILGFTGSSAQSYVLIMHAITFLGSSIIGVLCIIFHQNTFKNFYSLGEVDTDNNKNIELV